MGTGFLFWFLMKKVWITSAPNENELKRKNKKRECVINMKTKKIERVNRV